MVEVTEVLMGVPVGLVLLASFVWAVSKNFLTAQVPTRPPRLVHQ